MRSRVPIVLAIIALALAAVRGAAQSRDAAAPPTLASSSMLDPGAVWGANSHPPTACMASIAPKDTERQAVYLDARMAPGTSEIVLTQADLLASDVASTMNALLTTPQSPLAAIAGSMKYYSVPAELIVVARWNGEMRWRGVSLSGDSMATAILATALDSARHRGAAVMLWPDGLSDDSLIVRLSLLPGENSVVPAGKPGDRIPARFPAFVLPSPKITEPKLESEPLHYMLSPNAPGSDRVLGTAIVVFVVDTAGHPDMSTFHDEWPANTPRLRGTAAAYYDQLVGRMKAFVANSQYAPARVGPCRIPVMLRHSFSFDGRLSTDRYSKWE